jgi:hypothetical protein
MKRREFVAALFAAPVLAAFNPQRPIPNDFHADFHKFQRAMDRVAEKVRRFSLEAAAVERDLARFSEAMW